MAAKQLQFDEALGTHFCGEWKRAKAVKATPGPSGRNTILDKKFGSPTITKDGVTVAKEIELEDPYENMSAQLVREVASKTSDVAGDGTTTATVLAESIFREGMRNVTAGANPTSLQREIGKAVEANVAELAKISKKVSDRTQIAQVATVSANWSMPVGSTRSKSIFRSFRERSSRPTTSHLCKNSNSACLTFSPIMSGRHRPSTGPSSATTSMLFWPRSSPNDRLPQPDGIRHRNSERQY